jgi:hypothetical protein
MRCSKDEALTGRVDQGLVFNNASAKGRRVGFD